MLTWSRWTIVGVDRWPEAGYINAEAINAEHRRVIFVVDGFL